MAWLKNYFFLSISDIVLMMMMIETENKKLNKKNLILVDFYQGCMTNFRIQKNHKTQAEYFIVYSSIVTTKPALRNLI